jgi:glycerol-3-phosphate acyltransferase PlsY
LVLAGDIAKGIIAVLLAERLAGPGTSEFFRVLVGLAAVLGHMYSPWVDFAGGKGVATALGVFLAIATKPMAMILFVALGIIATTGFVSLAAVVGALLLPLILLVHGHGTAMLLVASGISLLVIMKHRGNLIRLFGGSERRVWDSKPEGDGSASAA